MTQEAVSPRKRSNSYNIFIFVLTLLSLGIMVVMLLPLAQQTLDLLRVYDNLVCIIFLIDFTYSLFSTPKKSDYFIKERGWPDLLGSMQGMWEWTVALGKPLAVGLPALALTLSVLGYVAVRLGWRIYVALAWRARCRRRQARS